MTMFKNIVAVSYPVKNWEQAKKFYDDVLGWPVAWSDDNVGWREYGPDDAAHISISRWTEATPPPQGGSTVVFSVDNADEAVSALRKKGVKCEDPVSIPGIVKYATFYDPEGNRLQMAESVPPPK